MRTLRTSGLSAAILALLAAAASGQSGRLAGTAKDPAGRGIRGATVTAVHPYHSPSSFTATTDHRGRYAMLGLGRGTWTVTVQAPGFETYRVDVAVPSTGSRTLDVALQPRMASPPGPLTGTPAAGIQERLDEAARLEAAGDLAGAVEVYAALAIRIPALTTIYLQIGSLHERLGDESSALTAYRRVLESDPQHEKARAAVARLEAAGRAR